LTSIRNVLNFKKRNVVSKGFLTLRYVNFTIDQIALTVKIYTGRKFVARAGFFPIPSVLGAPSITAMVSSWRFGTLPKFGADVKLSCLACFDLQLQNFLTI
jgi:hypothetical protein